MIPLGHSYQKIYDYATEYVTLHYCVAHLASTFPAGDYLMSEALPVCLFLDNPNYDNFRDKANTQAIGFGGSVEPGCFGFVEFCFHCPRHKGIKLSRSGRPTFTSAILEGFPQLRVVAAFWYSYKLAAIIIYEIKKIL